MPANRITLLDGELALGIYHDLTERHVDDAIKFDFREMASNPEGRLLTSDEVRIGLTLSEATALLSQLQAAIADYEHCRGTRTQH